MHATMPKSFDNPNPVVIDPEWERERLARLRYYQLSGYHLLRDISPRPSYFEAHNCDDDDLFLDKIGNTQVPWREQFGYPESDFEALVKDSVARFLWRRTHPTKLSAYPERIKHEFYHKFVRGSASLLYTLFPKDLLFKMGCSSTMIDQLVELLLQVQKHCPQGASLQVICENIETQLTSTDKNKYCFVTQPDIDTFLMYYMPERRFLIRGRHDLSFRGLPDKATDWDEIVLSVITKLVKEFDSSSTILEVNEYTKLLMTLLREDNEEQKEEIVAQAMQMADFGDIPKCVHLSSCGCRRDHDSVKDFRVVLGGLFSYVNCLMTSWVQNVTRVMFKLCNSDRHELSPVIAEIVEVAEIRRITLGNRFISRTYLLWEFYALGYSLPPAIRDVMIDVNSADKDVPPYHIYTAAVMVAESLGEYTVRLEHFIFAVLCSENDNFKGKQGVEIRQDFNVFQQALESSSDSSGVSNDSNLSGAMETI